MISERHFSVFWFLFKGNCLDPGWLISHEYTPSSPEDLQVSVDTRLDDAGQLQAVLQANWTLKDEGESLST